ncbi:hypothetical protein JIX56_21125 [Streptomyces sp. CA-210063]|uniref:hypothetical protein n=1 Tax=Streptomyces sp. CA-210063 TaxID=2801029 RepID=UPI00214B9E91|nr:hypothetical protein [Streptomyces sp. CA-210063]UUU32204.1 hypothetical protein JIX56_21125 [Streptomyces sp. CA-210063]
MGEAVGILIGGAAALAVPNRPDLIRDPVITWLQRARTALGLLATVWLVMAYPLRKGRQEFVLDKLENLAVGCAILLGAGALGITLFILAARSPLGGVYLRRLVGPLTVIGVIALGVGLCWLMVLALRGEIISDADIGRFDLTFGLFGETAGVAITGLAMLALLVVGAIACVLVLLISVFTTLLVTFMALNSCFRTADVHELLPALLSPLLVWSLFALSFSDTPDVAAPPAVIYSFLLGGPLTVTALSVWELRRLRVRHGVTLRTALGR